jgi:Tol biopolymer transport system component
MIALVLLLAAPAEDLQAKLRHLDSISAAWAPAPSPDGTRVAFLTTLTGTRQAASLPGQGGYPMQLTDEPSGVTDVRYLPSDGTRLIIAVVREGRRRLLLLDEEGSPPAPIDASPGDQFLGGFARDGKRLFYAVRSGAQVSLRTFAVDARKSVEVSAPPPAAGVQAPSRLEGLDQALSGFVALGPPSPDGRSILALVRRSGMEALVLADLGSARGEVLLEAGKEGRIRQPRFSPDGRSVYLLTDAGRATLGVDSIALQDHARKTLYAPAQNVQAFALAEDGRRFAVALESNGQNLFSLLEFPSMRTQPLAAPPAGALADGEMAWDRGGERLFFGWRLADDSTDVWELRVGRGTATRLTRSPRPGLPRDAIPRPALVRVKGRPAWLWRPDDEEKPRVAVLLAAEQIRPVFDKRIAALNFAGLAVLGISGSGAEKAALELLQASPDLDARDPVLLDPDGVATGGAGKWSAVLTSGPELDPDRPDLRALVRRARRGAAAQ